MSDPLTRGLRYTVVGALGTAVKIGALMLLRDAWGLGSVAAAALAVEASMLHNFAWHVRWTWRGRAANVPAQLVRFQLGSGAIALAVNVITIPLLTDAAGMNSAVAGLIGSIAGGLVNFALSELWVFAPNRGTQVESRSRAGAGV